ncbi:hypothetical protein WN66_02432 [Saccharomyces cerevisiae]|nr:hypothetical protein FOB22_002267 [Saccharomyces cerevisiae]KZV11250.1 hypothetical protein WN66_02432 [Saccharomyces cerevisiae]
MTGYEPFKFFSIRMSSINSPSVIFKTIKTFNPGKTEEYRAKKAYMQDKGYLRQKRPCPFYYRIPTCTASKYSIGCASSKKLTYTRTKFKFNLVTQRENSL